jgi:Splicing factor 3a, subunit 2
MNRMEDTANKLYPRNHHLNFVFRTPRGKTTVAIVPVSAPYDAFLRALLERAAQTDQEEQERSSNVNFQLSRLNLGVHRKVYQRPIRLVRRRIGFDCYIETESSLDSNASWINNTNCAGFHPNEESLQQGSEYDDYYSDCNEGRHDVNFSQLAYVVLNGKVLGRNEYNDLTREYARSVSPETTHHISLRVRVRGGIDRQNRVGSKFGGGGVSSEQQSERERKERLRQLALETVDLAKDPYLMRNHLGTYECKLCLTLHTNEG